MIAFNGGRGVSVVSLVNPTTGNRILGNSICSNGLLGIDLNADGVTANDVGDGDAGANDVQNYPVLSLAVLSVITGSLNSEPSKTYRVEYFTTPSCDTSGNGEGKTFLGFQSLTTNAFGNASISFGASLLPIGSAITATATNPAGSTSEFSACITAL